MAFDENRTKPLEKRKEVRGLTLVTASRCCGRMYTNGSRVTCKVVKGLKGKTYRKLEYFKGRAEQPKSAGGATKTFQLGVPFVSDTIGSA